LNGLHSQCISPAILDTGPFQGTQLSAQALLLGLALCADLLGALVCVQERLHIDLAVQEVLHMPITVGIGIGGGNLKEFLMREPRKRVIIIGI